MTHAAIAAKIFRRLGGNQVFDRPLAGDADLARVVQAGVSVKALEFTTLSMPELNRFVVNQRTLRHRKARNEALTPDETEKLVRVTRIQSIAEDVFGDAAKAERWLREPLNSLDDKTPLEFASTEPGARVIEQILAKIDWGAAA